MIKAKSQTQPRQPWPAFHDDWLLWVVDPVTHEVCEYNTESWAQHGIGDNWPAAIEHGRMIASNTRFRRPMRGFRADPTWTRAEFLAALNAWMRQDLTAAVAGRRQTQQVGAAGR